MVDFAIEQLQGEEYPGIFGISRYPTQCSRCIDRACFIVDSVPFAAETNKDGDSPAIGTLDTGPDLALAADMLG
ncbi:MAG: hypothetical protein R2839_11060 [Thermomicrobiales bacterium]